LFLYELVNLYKYNNEHIIKMNNSCICLICHKPNNIYLDFLKTFTSYDIVVVIDDFSINYYNDEYYQKEYPNFVFVQLDNVNCMENGFQMANLALNKMVSGWDKAIYFFSFYYKEYDYIWYIEDDIFFYNENVFQNIDMKYPDSDLLVKQIDERDDEKWLWDAVINHLPEPHYNSLVCVCRVSKQLLSCIYDYVKKYKQLIFIEMLFTSVAKANNLKCDCPHELVPVIYRYDWNVNNVNKLQLFHPVKDLILQAEMRETLNSEIDLKGRIFYLKEHFIPPK